MMDDRQFHRLLQHFGFSWEGYRRVRKGVKKRLRRHMQELGCGRLACYLEAVAHDPLHRRECLRRLSVPISRFMRDRTFWEIFVARILPDLVARFGSPLAAWSAGCACGEEAYSLAVSARIAGRDMGGDPPRLGILASDLNLANLARAREGIYPRSSFREVDRDLLARHFVSLRGGRRYRIRPEFQSDIRWLCCDLNMLPVNTDFQLVLLRNNILTYLEPTGQTWVLCRLREHIQPGGVLVVGQRERLPAGVGGFRVRYGLPYVYERVAAEKGDAGAGG